MGKGFEKVDLMLQKTDAFFPYLSTGGWTIIHVNRSAEVRKREGVRKRPFPSERFLWMAPHAKGKKVFFFVGPHRLKSIITSNSKLSLGPWPNTSSGWLDFRFVIFCHFLVLVLVGLWLVPRKELDFERRVFCPPPRDVDEFKCVVLVQFLVVTHDVNVFVLVCC